MKMHSEQKSQKLQEGSFSSAQILVLLCPFLCLKAAALTQLSTTRDASGPHTAVYDPRPILDPEC